MRLWHKNMIEFLPNMQLKGQWRECVLIAKDLQEKGKTNHLLINILENYTYDEFMTYCWSVYHEMHKRGFTINKSTADKVFGRHWLMAANIFCGWHNKEYYRICMVNLYEKYKYGRGKSRITDTEWQRLLEGYKFITNEKWVL